MGKYLAVLGLKVEKNVTKQLCLAGDETRG